MQIHPQPHRTLSYAPPFRRKKSGTNFPERVHVAHLQVHQLQRCRKIKSHSPKPKARCSPVSNAIELFGNLTLGETQAERIVESRCMMCAGGDVGELAN